MAKSINRAVLLGNMGRDPELRSTPSGLSVCTFTIATSESFKDKNGEWQEKTEWHNVVCWDRLANQVSESFRKGSKVYVEGKTTHRTYEGKDGATRYITEVVASSVIGFGSKEGSIGGGSSYSNDEFPDYQSADTSSQLSDDVPF